MAKEETHTAETAAGETAEDREEAVPEKFAQLVENIEKLSVLELSELVKVLEKKFGVSASAPAAAAPAAAPAEGEGGETAEEKSSFNVMLQAIGDQKIEVIKVVRDATGKGLKEAKDLVDAAASAPQLVKEGAKKDEAEGLKQKLEGAGAKVELQ